MTKENWLTFFAVVYMLFAIIGALVWRSRDKKPDEWEWYEE